MIITRSRPDGVPSVVGFAGVLGIAAVVLTGVTIRFAWQNRPTPIDVWWHDLMASHRNGVADAVAPFLNTFGGTLWMTLVTAAIVARAFAPEVRSLRQSRRELFVPTRSTRFLGHGCRPRAARAL